MATTRKTVFVSYAHEDRKWADELGTVLAPWIRDKRLDAWDDSRIDFGSDWRADIERAIDDATVAVLLVTKHFLASDFIMNHELPLLLERADAKRLRLAWIAVAHAAVDATGLTQVQAINDPSRPLDGMRRAKRDEVWVDIAKRIADAVTINTFAGGLEVIDETTEPIRAAVEARRENPNPTFGVQAAYDPARDQISFSGTSTTITAADLEKLPDEDREFIADLQDSLRDNYRLWRAARQAPVSGAEGGGQASAEEIRISRLICRDLDEILDFLRKMHKYDLEDHYGRYRYICQKLRDAGGPAVSGAPHSPRPS